MLLVSKLQQQSQLLRLGTERIDMVLRGSLGLQYTANIVCDIDLV